MFLGHPPKVGNARPRGRAGSWLSPCWGLRLRQRQRRISHTRVLLNKLLASTSTRSVSADSARTSLRTVAMRTSQNALVCVVTPLGNRPFGNRPKTAVPVLTPPVNRCLVNHPENHGSAVTMPVTMASVTIQKMPNSVETPWKPVAGN